MLNFEEINNHAGSEEPYEGDVASIASTPDFEKMPEGVTISVFESYFPECYITRDGGSVVAEITEHIYTKYWSHKYHGYVFAEAMVRAVKRLAAEGHPLTDATIENEDEPHIFVRWTFKQAVKTSGKKLVDSLKAAFDLVWSRANEILDNSDSVLILGKDTGDGMERLRRIEAELQRLGYFTYIIKDQPDKIGETVVQKVLRYALSSRFVIVENTEPSGHLYEIPHVGKMAECATAFLQEEGKGATWMFADAYMRMQHWKVFSYKQDEIEAATREAAAWSEDFVKRFGQYQQQALPWLARAAPQQQP